MKFVVLFDPTKAKPEDRLITFRHDEPGPIPPIITPVEEDNPKDTEPPKPKESHKVS